MKCPHNNTSHDNLINYVIYYGVPNPSGVLCKTGHLFVIGVKFGKTTIPTHVNKINCHHSVVTGFSV